MSISCAMWDTGNDQDEYGFERGSQKSYELDTGQELGVLRQVHVQQASGHGHISLSISTPTSWFCPVGTKCQNCEGHVCT